MSPDVGAARIVVCSTSSLADQPGFVDILRIQLVGSGSVELGPAMIDGSVGERVTHATRVVTERDATLVVWIERGPAIAGSGNDFILYLVGPRRDRALVEVFRLPVSSGPEVDRALALKVRAVLDSILAEAGEPSPPWIGIVKPKSERSYWFVAELGVGFAAGLGSPASQGGPRLGAGMSATVGQLIVAGVASVALVDGFTERSRVGKVATSEIPLALGLRAMAQRGAIAVGGQLELGLRIIDADGTTPFGATGSVNNLVPTIMAGPTGALRLRDGVELRALVGVEVALLRLHLAVNEVAVMDLGRLRPVAHLTLLVTLP